MSELKRQETGGVKTALPEHTPREFIELVSCPEMGKHDAILSLADTWQKLRSDGKVYILDTEGLRETWERTLELANIYYWYCQDMDTVTSALGEITRQLSSRDWLCVESLTRIWGFSQDKKAYIHDFMNVLVGLKCNILVVTTLGKEQGLESGKEMHQALGLNVPLDGDPQSPHYPDTVLLMAKKTDGIWCLVLKDRGRRPEQVKFKVENWWLDFLTNCR